MGQGNAFSLAKDTFQAEQFLKYQEARHAIVHRAFQKCVAPTSEGATDPLDLREDERLCVEEYALLYANFSQREFTHFSSLYEQLQKDMHEIARHQQMEAMARQDLQQ